MPVARTSGRPGACAGGRFLGRISGPGGGGVGPRHNAEDDQDATLAERKLPRGSGPVAASAPPATILSVTPHLIALRSPTPSACRGGTRYGSGILRVGLTPPVKPGGDNELRRCLADRVPHHRVQRRGRTLEPSRRGRNRSPRAGRRPPANAPPAAVPPVPSASDRPIEAKLRSDPAGTAGVAGRGAAKLRSDPAGTAGVAGRGAAKLRSDPAGTAGVAGRGAAKLRSVLKGPPAKPAEGGSPPAANASRSRANGLPPARRWQWLPLRPALPIGRKPRRIASRDRRGASPPAGIAGRSFGADRRAASMGSDRRLAGDRHEGKLERVQLS